MFWVDFGHSFEDFHRRHSIVAASGNIPELAIGHVVKISEFCTDAHLFIACGERVDNQSRHSPGEKMVDHSLFQLHLWRVVEVRCIRSYKRRRGMDLRQAA